MKSNSKTWDVILKVIIAVVSALAGALGVQAMTL
ncbi:smalltalk protein [Bacteroides sp. 519]|nr:smalltalk protein [Bacteroides sp. 519]